MRIIAAVALTPDRLLAVVLLTFPLFCFAAPPLPVTKTLDLRLPEITTILSQEQIDRALASTRDPDTIEEVEVEGIRTRSMTSTPVISTPIVAAGLFSPFWALAHPTQAWRIFAPLPPDQVLFVGNITPDATDSYRPVALPR